MWFGFGDVLEKKKKIRISEYNNYACTVYENIINNVYTFLKNHFLKMPQVSFH